MTVMHTPQAGYIRKDNFESVLTEDGTFNRVLEQVRLNTSITRDELIKFIRENGKIGYTLYLETEGFVAIKEHARQPMCFSNKQ